jgi:hypothetical protein
MKRLALGYQLSCAKQFGIASSIQHLRPHQRLKIVDYFVFITDNVFDHPSLKVYA